MASIEEGRMSGREGRRSGYVREEGGAFKSKKKKSGRRRKEEKDEGRKGLSERWLRGAWIEVDDEAKEFGHSCIRVKRRRRRKR